jgi:hypothetical protein
MPKRMIDTDLWNDDDIIADFTAEDKYFWLYLLTNPHNNICGVLKYSPALMARDMGLHKDTIINLLYRFERVHHRLYVDRDTNEILILNWSKYNWTKSEDFLKTIQKKLVEIRSLDIQNILIEKIKEKLDKTVLRPSQEGTNTISNSNTISNIFSYWNDKHIIMHRELTEDISKAIEKALKLYSEEEVKTYIDRYAKVIGDKNYFWHYKWSLKDFLTRKEGISAFNDEGSKWVSYCENRNKTPEKTRYGTFDVNEAFASAVERTFNENLDGNI